MSAEMQIDRSLMGPMFSQLLETGWDSVSNRLNRLKLSIPGLLVHLVFPGGVELTLSIDSRDTTPTGQLLHWPKHVNGYPPSCLYMQLRLHCPS
jgi:hypothetical protein